MAKKNLVTKKQIYTNNKQLNLNIKLDGIKQKKKIKINIRIQQIQ